MNTETAPVHETLSETFTEDIQQKIGGMLLWEPDLLPEIIKKIRPEHFENPVLSDSVLVITKFYEHFARQPSFDEFLQDITLLLETSKIPKPPEVYFEQIERIMAETHDMDFAYVRLRLNQWLRHQTVKAGLLKSISIFQTNFNCGEIKKVMTEALEGADRGEDLDVVDLAGVKRQEVEWFWQNKIPRAKLSLIFGDPVIATAILVRILHHSTTINIKGNSYRLKEKVKAGLIRAPEDETN